MSAKNLSRAATGRIYKPKFTVPEPPEAYFDSFRQHYWVQDDRKRWMPYNEMSLKRLFKAAGISAKVGDDEMVSALDRAILNTQQARNVDYAASLAGYQKGIYEILGSRVLVVDSPNLIKGRPGKWETLMLMLHGLLVDENVDQSVYLFGWLKVALESLHAGHRRPGQALAVAGPKDCGKSLLQKLITELLGGRMASPYQFMTAQTPFNGEMFRAEHLVVEDNAASTDIRARRTFGALLKTITVNDHQPCYSKGKQAVSLTPFWRLTISVNCEPENLMVLPPVDDSIEDKLILLRAFNSPMPMPTGTMEERRRFWDQLVSELPAFVHFLQEWEIPAALRSQRFGITHYHNPALLRTLDDLAPESQLLELIDSELFSGPAAGAWEGKADALEKRLTGSESSSVYEVRRLLSYRSACGSYLGRLEKKHPARVGRRTVHGSTIWTLEPPQIATTNLGGA